MARGETGDRIGVGKEKCMILNHEPAEVAKAFPECLPERCVFGAGPEPYVADSNGSTGRLRAGRKRPSGHCAE